MSLQHVPCVVDARHFFKFGTGERMYILYICMIV